VVNPQSLRIISDEDFSGGGLDVDLCAGNRVESQCLDILLCTPLRFRTNSREGGIVPYWRARAPFYGQGGDKDG
jgi:hypothetical protein